MKDTIIEAVKNSIDKGWKEGKEWLDHLDNFEEGMLEIIIPAIVFDHKFAKARWGEGYKTHLQKMVLSLIQQQVLHTPLKIGQAHQQLILGLTSQLVILPVMVVCLIRLRILVMV